ncbi:hypothetical protein DQW50_17365 [Halorubrum sp. 48-1-W]|nr:hypothetical protein DQW50_17365 [Halorubrum sp. 48-1-W]
MRKKELVSTHALLLEVSHHLIENENMPAERMDTYHEAINVLGMTIEGEFKRTRTPPVSL